MKGKLHMEKIFCETCQFLIGKVQQNSPLQKTHQILQNVSIPHR